MLRQCRACRTCYEDATRKLRDKLLPRNLALTSSVVVSRPWMKTFTNSCLTILDVYDLFCLVLDPAVTLILDVIFTPFIVLRF